METFEYPRSSAGLFLLVNLRQTEREAEAHGVAEPELRFEENSDRLTFFVAGTDHRFEYGDTHMRPKNLLEELEREGCVDIERDTEDSPGNSGTLTITERGRKKIKARMDYESNLPHLFKKWEMSLLGVAEVEVSKLWRATWEGHQINVRNRRSLTLGRSAPNMMEYMDVDHRKPLEYTVERSRLAKDLRGKWRTASGMHEIRAHIGLTAPLFTTGCLILVDDVVIGGDITKKFIT